MFSSEHFSGLEGLKKAYDKVKENPGTLSSVSGTLENINVIVSYPPKVDNILITPVWKIEFYPGDEKYVKKAEKLTSHKIFDYSLDNKFTFSDFYEGDKYTTNFSNHGIKWLENTYLKEDNHYFLHSFNDKPSHYSFNFLDNIVTTTWHVKDVIYRKVGPSSLKTYLGETIEKSYTDENGLYHRDEDLPSYTTYFPNGNIKNKRFFKNGKQYRTDNKPSSINYTVDKMILVNEWTDEKGKLIQKNSLDNGIVTINIYNKVDKMDTFLLI